MKILFTLLLMAFSVKAQTNTIYSGRVVYDGLLTNGGFGYVCHWTYPSNQVYFATNNNPGGIVTFSCTKTNPLLCIWFCYDTFRGGRGTNFLSIQTQTNEFLFFFGVYSPYFYLAKPPVPATTVGFKP